MPSLVSVVVPAYNTELYVGECIRSIVSQTYTELEVLLINDGSTDGTGGICREWAEADHRIRYAEKENGGQGAARNLGIQMATGDYIIFVDSDDYLDRDMVRKVLGRIEEEGADICIYAHKEIGGGIEVCRPLEFKLAGSASIKGDADLLGHILPAMWAKMFSAALLKGSGLLMDNRICEDLAFCSKLYLRAGKICMLDEPLYYYRYKREGNISTDYPRFAEVMQSIDGINSYFAREGCFGAYWPQLYRISFDELKYFLMVVRGKRDVGLPPTVGRQYPQFLSAYKACLGRWFSQYLDIGLQDKNYLLVGSYSLRAIAHSLLLDEGRLKGDYASSSIISIMSDCAAQYVPLGRCSFQNPYRQRCVEQDVQKSFRHGCLRGIDYVVLDLMDEASDLVRVTDTCYVTESEFLLEQHLEEMGSYKRIPFLSGERRGLFLRYLPLFAEKISQMGIPVVVVKNFLCERHSEYYDVSTAYEQAGHIREVNQELGWCYQQLLDCLPGAVVVDASGFKGCVFTDERCPFGCRPEYFNRVYYQKMALQIARKARGRKGGAATR